jgi:hypothetical protein
VKLNENGDSVNEDGAFTVRYFDPILSVLESLPAGKDSELGKAKWQ